MIELKNVSLSIPIYNTESKFLKRKIINSIAGGRINLGTDKVPIVQALNKINCTIKNGDRVALIGHNGSGKTCLLKIISGVYSPTGGHIKINLRVFPMIQKSFISSQDLSGYIAAKAYYLYVNKNDKGFKEFIESVKNFSGIGDFIYLPLKTYSEGMASRLLFTILTSFNHDCLVMDEGFNAGDTFFMDQAEKRMEDFISNSGTLILASHNDELLKRFCNRGIILDKGKIIYDGKINDAIESYENKLR